MNTTDLLITPIKALNKAYRRQPVDRPDIERFKENLKALLKGINPDESEEHLKNNVTTFLKDTWYKGEFAINTKGRTDLVIHNDKTTNSTPGVLLEIKRLGNREMVSKDNLNTKALQELVLYYLRERIEEENKDIKHLIITNAHEWFIFDGNVFYQCFYKNPKLLKAFKEWSAGQKDSAQTTMFFKDIAGPAIEEQKEKLTFTWFDFDEVTSELNKGNDSQKLISFYKVLSPVHLLNQQFANDSNSLNKQFYHELLHIIGLEEVKEGGKKLIRRKEKDKRDDGSLLENAINIMEERDRHRVLDNPTHFGNTVDEQLYNVALELCITWVNRILFLKLLESQLVTYRKGDKEYRFLDISTIPNFDSLESLFFGVLAKKQDERNERYREKFVHVPYLNSSLFEPTGLEEVLTITMLNNNLGLELYNRTVIADGNGNRQTGSKDTLTYLFEFLEAYNFSSEGKEEVQEVKKSLINASVLGLIFEKINGYKDGSFYTPGFITMYMCRETIRRAVVQKFNEAWGWKCKEFEDLKEDLVEEIRTSDKGRNKVRKEANEIINGLKICDPAVGSGHFLVSALNEIITIKSELHILTDRKGEVLSEYVVEIDNDELAISNLEAELFQYLPTDRESQRIQEALFHEKQTIIENCLFGVDINPNSVKICRLRLWIELLKNAYYKNETELETLPNIDINIKRGNSLISRFSLDEDLSKALKSIKYSIDDYRSFVNDYKNATDKEEKRGFKTLIDQIKSNFRTQIANYSDPDKIRLKKLEEQMFQKYQSGQLYELKLSEKQKKDRRKLESQINKVSEKIKNKISDPIFQDAFEWRFEFPEVLDDEGNFVGFDVVIGNPPYIRVQELGHSQIDYYKSTYSVAFKRVDISILFFELSHLICHDDSTSTLITSNQFIGAEYGEKCRIFLKDKTSLLKIIDFQDLPVFEEALTYVSIFIFTNTKINEFGYSKVKSLEEAKEFDFGKLISINIQDLDNKHWSLVSRSESDLMNKISSFPKLTEYGSCHYGIVSGNDEVFLLSASKIEELGIESDVLLPLVRAQNCDRYATIETDQFILYPYHLENNKTSLIPLETLKIRYPNTYEYLLTKKESLEKRKDSRKTFEGRNNWYTLTRFGTLDVFKSEKILWPGETKHHKFGLSKTTAGYSGARVFGLTLSLGDEKSLKVLIGILNSSLSEYYLHRIAALKQGGYYSYSSGVINEFPIPDFSSPEIYERVNEIFLVKNGKSRSDTSDLEKEIDELVYELYGLSDKEIRIVENQNISDN